MALFKVSNLVKRMFNLGAISALLLGAILAPASAANLIGLVIEPPVTNELRVITAKLGTAKDVKIRATDAMPSDLKTANDTYNQPGWNGIVTAAYSKFHNAAYAITGQPGQPYNTDRFLLKIDSSGITEIGQILFLRPDNSTSYEMRHLAIDKNGNAYIVGLENYNSKIWTFDLNLAQFSDTTAKSISGAINSSDGAISGFAYNPANEKFYATDWGAANSNKRKLFEINVTTGATSLVGLSKDDYMWEKITFDDEGNIYAVLNNLDSNNYSSSTWNKLFKTNLSQWSTLTAERLGLGTDQYSGVVYAATIASSNSGGNSNGGNSNGGNSNGGNSNGGSTSTPTTSGSGSTSALAAGELSGLAVTPPATPPAQGSSTTTVGGSTVRTSTSSSDASDSVTSSNGGTHSSSVTFKDIDDGNTVPLTTNDTIGAEPGSDLSITGRGFKGRSQVQAYLIDANGKSTYLGKINTSVFGRVKGKLKVPTNLPAGKYTLQLNGYTKKQQLVKSTNLGMEVVQDDLGSLYFESDSAAATEETRAVVKEMAKSLDAGETVILYGFTSGNPDAKYYAANMYLAKKRTNTIKSLFAELGVKSTIVIEPQGAVSPFGSGGGHAKNRRVDVKPTS